MTLILYFQISIIDSPVHFTKHNVLSTCKRTLYAHQRNIMGRLKFDANIMVIVCVQGVDECILYTVNQEIFVVKIFS